MNAQQPTKCIIHGADKEDICFIFAQHHGLYINVSEHCMRQFIFTTILFILSVSAWGQVRGGLLVNGQRIKTPKNVSDHFEFDFSSSELDDSSKFYLDYFGEFYKDKLRPTDTLVIVLEPGLSEAEQENNSRRLRMRRVMTVSKYLDKHFNIEIDRARFTETITACRLVAVPTRKGYILKNIK